jgi:putative ATP-binding cassette transporter
MSLGFFACLVGNLSLALAVNRWSKEFFDALQFHDIGEIVRNMEELGVLVAGTAVFAIGTIQCRMRLQVGWRIWITSSLMDRWLRRDVDSEITASRTIDNPDARIADDGRIAVELFVDLAGGVINIFLVSISFIIVLWKVGGSEKLFGVAIPGYLVFAVVIYTAITSLGAFILGRPLIRSVEEKAAAEGDFRFALTQAREQLGGSNEKPQPAEKADLRSDLNRLANRWMPVIAGQTRISLLGSANNLLAPAVPLLLCAPKFLAGAMTLGDLIQAAAAFVQVQTALNWLADNAVSIANWSASAHRVAALDLDNEKRAAASTDRA